MDETYELGVCWDRKKAQCDGYTSIASTMNLLLDIYAGFPVSSACSVFVFYLGSGVSSVMAFRP